jgi:hypothetical protein
VSYRKIYFSHLVVSATMLLPVESVIKKNIYILHAKGDERPYLEVSIIGYPFKGLLNSGASHTLLGGGGWSILERSGVQLNKIKMQCMVANGAKCACLGLVVPDIPLDLILGIDFWKSMNIFPVICVTIF